MMMERRNTRIAIAAATRQRPRMFAALLASFHAMECPQGTEVVFVFVENDTVFGIQDIVDDFSRRSGRIAKAVHVTKPGIAGARNAAMDAATAMDADWLAFVDDDEQVRRDWLRILWAETQRHSFDLAGGPVVPMPPDGGASDQQERVLSYWRAAAKASSKRSTSARDRGKRFDLPTNNWLGDLRKINALGLRFDPDFNLSGGEDTDFSRRAHAAGLALGFVEGAVVTEEVPAERLTGQYIFDRARHQTITKFGLKRSQTGAKAIVQAVFQIVFKGAGSLCRIVLSPITGRYSYYRGIRGLGEVAGWWSGLRGQEQASYSSVTGS